MKAYSLLPDSPKEEFVARFRAIKEKHGNTNSWVVALCIVTLLALGFFSVHQISLSQMHSRLPTVTPDLAVYRYLDKNPHSFHDYATYKCSPYELRGTMHLSAENQTQNRWNPFDSTDCEVIDWTEEIRLHNQKQRTQHDLTFLQNKTVSLFGDSLDRYLVEHFCEYLGIWTDTIMDEHPASPKISKELFEKEPRPKEGHDYNSAWSKPKHCHVPSLNLSMISVFHFSLNTPQMLKDRGIMDGGHYYPPARPIDRFDYIVKPLLANLGRGMDLFSFGSLMWDIYNDEAAERLDFGGLVVEPPRDEVIYYGAALRENLLELAAKLDDNIRFLWKQPHTVTNSGEAFSRARVARAFELMADSVLEDLTGRPWPLLKNAAQAKTLDRLADPSAILYNRVFPGGLARMRFGYEHWQLDFGHYGKSQNYINANYIIDELYRHTLHLMSAQSS